MKALVQRVIRGSVTIDGLKTAEIGPGFVVLLGVCHGDTAEDARHLADKTANLRIFADASDKMNLSLLQTGRQALVISQFTLYADTARGNRPSFVGAAPPELAEKLYDLYTEHLRTIMGSTRVATGVFRASMTVEIINDGPVTIELSTDQRPGPIGVQT
ncbi:MAG: D-aminoacyl-tRNA deacylase [bacterium]